MSLIERSVVQASWTFPESSKDHNFRMNQKVMETDSAQIDWAIFWSLSRWSMIIRVIVFLNSTVIDTVTEVSTNLCVDWKQCLFFFRFSKGNARAREGWAQKPRDARNEGASSRAFSHARGLRVSGVLLDGPRKKRDCSLSNLCGSESSSELKWVNN